MSIIAHVEEMKGQSDSQVYGNLGMLLKERASDLLEKLPSEVDSNEILELEVFLNRLYIHANKKNWAEELQEAILEALSRAGELSDRIKKSGPMFLRGQDFYRIYKSLPNLFAMIAYFIEEENSKAFLT